MREILFRGKRTDTGEWVYGDLLNVGVDYDYAIRTYGGREHGQVNAVNEKTVGQYTGLTDRNGTRIFEGDIVRDMHKYSILCKYVEFGMESRENAEKHRNDGLIAAVEFSTEDVGSCGCCYTAFEGSGFIAAGVDLNDCEVIGNIHDNPELLEG